MSKAAGRPPNRAPRPADLSARTKTRRGRPPVSRPEGERVRTVLYVQRDTLDWYGQASIEETGKKNRRNDLIERVLEEYRAEVEAAAGDDTN